MVKLNVGEAFEFSDLKTMVAFFRDGTGQDAAALRRVLFLSISYRDDDTVAGLWQLRTDYAYGAFEALYKYWHVMQISKLQLCLPCSQAISFVNDPGI